MNFTEYQIAASRTSTPDTSLIEVFTMAMGAGSETGEILSELKKSREQCRDIDRAKITEEIGDTLWYLAALCRKLDLRLEDSATGNILKLLERYPNGFTPRDSIRRKDKEHA